MATFDAIEEFLPTSGMLELYLRFTQGNEICPRFRFFSIIAATGAILKRKVWHQRSSYDLLPTTYPNPWIILVAPQGVGHKSAALRQAKKLVEALETELQPKTMSNKLTPEVLVKNLATQILPDVKLTEEQTKFLKRPAQALLFSSELGTLLGKQKYNEGMIALLTDLYDCHNEWSSDTVMRGNQCMYDICLSIMAGSTPDWMQTMLPPDAFKGGFMSRLLLIGFPENWRKRIADPAPGDQLLKEELLANLTRIAKLEGEIKWTPEAKSFFSYWYNNLEEPPFGPIAAYLERKQDHLLRLAIIMEVAKSDELVLHKETLEQALNILSVIEKDTFKMLEIVTLEPKMRPIQTILDYLQVEKEAPESEVIKQCWKQLNRPSEFSDMIQLLLKTKMVQAIPKDKTIYYQLKETGGKLSVKY